MPSRIVCAAAGGMTESRKILTLILKAAHPARYTARLCRPLTDFSIPPHTTPSIFSSSTACSLSLKRMV